MSALPPEQMRVMRATAEQAARPVGSLAQRWEDLHRKAAELATLAQLAPEASQTDGAAFATILGNADEWQRELAWQSIEDIDAMMQPGLTALKVITSRGMDANAPALALWREFHAAREGVLHLLVTDRRSVARI
ncbi:hypothetical protein [Erythrobacter crassostreae]|uniref:Uncharacterized protein n=1 Tax=Erythrobacter crassostreae TaxID=2828328 RepID=A0A9X1F1N0_9SPHN|nr:hypothetical protein [Erythrobacter crassostrea]MBV7258657.1 hypothetical protein [Erythrobacter crassostrea]